MATTDPRDDPLNRYAYNIIDDHISTLHEKYGIIPPAAPIIPPTSQSFSSGSEERLVDIHKEAHKVGIIGAGIGGLYAAMLLQERGFHYEILEASSRIGGRLFTHKMGDRPNDYYVRLRQVVSDIYTHMRTRTSGLCVSRILRS